MISSTDVSIPRAFDIMHFIEGMDNFMKNDASEMQGLSADRQTRRLFEMAGGDDDDDEDEEEIGMLGLR